MVEGGVGSVTMTAACERSGVTGRYFYDHFADRDALVAAAFEESVQQTMQSVVGAITAARRESCDPARAAITSFVSAFERDPRLARIGLIDATDSRVLRPLRRRALAAFTDLVAAGYGAPTDAAAQLAASYAVGGLCEVLSRWFAGSLDLSGDQVIDACTELFHAAKPSTPALPTPDIPAAALSAGARPTPASMG